MSILLQDVRYALRFLAKAPGTTLTMVLLLAVGIGANTAIFSLVDALFFKPLPIEHASHVVGVYAKGHVSYRAGFSYPEYLALRDHNTSFSSIAADSVIAQLHLLIDGDAKETRGAFVTANYFSVLGLRPQLGRFFLTEEDQAPDRNPVVVISDELWKSRFSGDVSALGREFVVNGTHFTVIGVAPPSFHGFNAGNPEELWMPTMMLHAAGYLFCQNTYDCTVLDELIGKLAPGSTLASAQDELKRIVVWSASDWPASEGTRQIFVLPVAGANPDEKVGFTAQMQLLMASAAALLLIACANLAGLFLTRNLSRKKEIAIRLAIGAGRGRITRQLMTESMLLSVAGCLLAFPVSFWARSLLAGYYTLDSEGFTHAYDLALDWRVLLFSIGLALLTAVVFGLGPALRATRADLIAGMKDSWGASASEFAGWWRKALVAAQVALSLMLLICAGLLVRSSIALGRGTNFDPQHLSLIRIRPEMLRYTAAQNEKLYRQVVQRLQELPGVVSTTLIRGGQGLVWDWESGREVAISLPNQPHATAQKVRYHDIGLDFFRTLRIPLLQGRDFNSQDLAGSPRVAIVNETLAKQLWPRKSAIGQVVLINDQPVQVAGVSASIQPSNSLKAAAPYVYFPFWQLDPGKDGDVRIAVRVAGDPVATIPLLRKAIQSIDPAVPMGEDMSMLQQMQAEYMPVLLSRTIVSACGLLALCLSALGLYSVLTFAVRTRVREIGVRMALGAQSKDVLRLMLRQGISLALLGAGFGLAGGLAATRLLASWIYGVRSTDLLSYAGGATLLIATSTLASYLPARRAARVDPLTALRHE